MGSNGGLTKGKSHAKGGIDMTVKSTGQQIEVEGGEGIINKYVMSDDDKYDFEGKEMTACEIASDLNQQNGNGVKFSCEETENTDLTPLDKEEGFSRGGGVKGSRIEIEKTDKNITTLNNVLKTFNAGSVRFDSVNATEINATLTDDTYSDEYIELASEIKENGVVPILVNDKENGQYSIWDGNHRFEILTNLGVKEIPIYIYSGNDIEDLEQQSDFIEAYANNSPLVRIKKINDGGKTKPPFPNTFYIIIKKDGKRRYVGGDSASSFIYLEDARAKAKKEDKIIITDGITQISEAFSRGGGVHTMPNGEVILKYVNFEDGWHINLKRLKDYINQNKGNNKYVIIRQDSRKEQELWEFETLNEANAKFNELVELGKTYSKIEKQFAKGGGIAKTIKTQTNPRHLETDAVEEILEDLLFSKGGNIEMIECQNCGWDWKVSDGGDDLYICHKCNTDNEFSKGGNIFGTPNSETTKIAQKYIRENSQLLGLTDTMPTKVTTLDYAKSIRLADEYEAMKDAPTDRKVQEAYEVLAHETEMQYNAVIDKGYKLELWDGKGEPYANSAELLKDISDNKHMYVFATEGGFGEEPITDLQRDQNAMLRKTGYKDVKGKPLLVNDLFRFVHDFFGHSELGNSFGAIGEENAWMAHSRMFSPQARRAMTTETRGQNSWVNFGKHIRRSDNSIPKKGDSDYTPLGKRPFADQKMNLIGDDYTFAKGGEVPLLTGSLEERRKKFSELKLKFKKDGRGYYSSSINVDGNNWKWLIEGSEKHWTYTVEKNGNNIHDDGGVSLKKDWISNANNDYWQILNGECPHEEYANGGLVEWYDSKEKDMNRGNNESYIHAWDCVFGGDRPSISQVKKDLLKFLMEEGMTMQELHDQCEEIYARGGVLGDGEYYVYVVSIYNPNTTGNFPRETETIFVSAKSKFRAIWGLKVPKGFVVSRVVKELDFKGDPVISKKSDQI